MNRPADALTTATPGARELAILGSLATRIEPPLLRALRLEGQTGLDVSAEAELWFSDLVATRAVTGLVLADHCLAELRTSLAADTEKLELAWAITRDVHANVSPALRVEEELVYLSLKGLDDDATRARAQALLRQVVATLVDDSRRGTVSWADRALARFPTELMALEEARMLAAGTAYRSGRGRHFEAVDHSLGSQRYRWLEPASKGRSVHARLVEGGLEIGGNLPGDAHSIDVPDVSPLRIDLAWGEGESGGHRRIELGRGESQFVALDASSVRVSVPGGDEFIIAEAETASPVNDRVRIVYESERSDGAESIELPFVIGVLSDLSGEQVERIPADERRFLDVTRNNLDSSMKALRPRLSLRISADPIVDAEILIELDFTSMRDFEPPQIYRFLMQSMPSIYRVTEARRTLQEIHEKAEGNFGPEDILARFEKTMQDPDDVALYVREMINELLDTGITESGGLQQAVHGVIAELDEDLGLLVDRILHHEAFLRLESAWRGLAFLTDRAGTSADVRIRFMDLSLEELGTLQRNRLEAGAFGDPLFRQLVEEPFGTFGGEPFGLIVADYEFAIAGGGIDAMRYLSRVASAAGAPIVTGCSPESLGLDSWKQAEDSQFQELLDRPDQAPWRDLRARPESRFLQICIPRLLARDRYDRRSGPMAEFVFDEQVEQPVTEHHPWTNAAFAMAVNAARSFGRDGWFARMRGAEFGRLDDLPRFSVEVMDESSAFKQKEARYYNVEAGPTDVAIMDRAEFTLSRAGFATFCAMRQSNSGVFYSTTTIHSPDERHMDDDPVARGNTDLRRILVAARFGHFLRCIVRDAIGGFATRAELESHLNDWVARYVYSEGSAETQRDTAEQPIGPATVVVRETDDLDSGQRGYDVELHIRPIHQFDEPGIATVLAFPIPFEPMGFASEFAEEAPAR